MPTDSDRSETLRSEVAQLGELLGRTVQDAAGEQSLQVVESVRRAARDRRGGDADADQRLQKMLSDLDNAQLRVVIRAFSILLDLANLAEDRQRVRVLQQRERALFPEPRSESIQRALQELKAAGKTHDQMQQLVDALRIELVFTAHPTEAKRRSARHKLRRIRNLLDDLDHRQLPTEAEEGWRLIRAEMMKLWLTDFIRPWRPTVLQEVQRGLSIKPVLWDVAPRMTSELRQSLASAYEGRTFDVRPCLTFGSWIGGDRDGHPYVTAEVTEQTLKWLRQAALEMHLASCNELFDSLSLSARQMNVAEDFRNGIDCAAERWPQIGEELREIPPNEMFRRWLAVIKWRLKQTQSVDLDGTEVPGAYALPRDLAVDVERIRSALSQAPCDDLLAADVCRWLDRIGIFGFHLARLDVRQDSRRYESVINELLAKTGVCPNPADLDERQRCEALSDTLEEPILIPAVELSEEARESLALFRLLRRVVHAYGRQALGGHVVSMTRRPSDILAVLWLWRHAQADRADGERHAGSLEQTPPLPVVPLFETIDDLKSAGDVFEQLLGLDAYRRQLIGQSHRQTVMLGYSDSTKDGGYLAACWSLYRCQQTLQEIAAREGIDLTFFHGRGGSLGRGGGPAARGILSLPPGAFHGSLRLTEQGEVLADRYDDPRIAHRHLEQIMWSALLAGGSTGVAASGQWLDTMQRMSDRSQEAYRELVRLPGFVEFFRRATPISEIEQMPIGSRPSRRRGGDALSDLRAIPWVFSWTQSRCLIPAWFGFGSSMAPMLDDADALAELRAMFRKWPFFRATVENAELALAKTDLGIADRYARLANDSETLSRVGEIISAEFRLSRRAVLAVTESESLLEKTPWLKESIRVRNRYIDPLNLIQIELLRRLRNREGVGDPAEIEELRHLTRLTIKGLAAGMRTTG